VSFHTDIPSLPAAAGASYMNHIRKNMNTLSQTTILPMCNRIEVIGKGGITYASWKEVNAVKIDIQDNGRTLKISILYPEEQQETS
jgi:hypothetical protein